MPLRYLILHNFWLKVFSLFFATLIWFALQPNKADYKFPQSLFPRPKTLELRCPITVMTAPGNHSPYKLDPSAVIVVVEGEDAILKRLTPENIQVYVKLTDVPNFTRLFRVEVIVPHEVTFKEVMPDQISVQPWDK